MSIDGGTETVLWIVSAVMMVGTLTFIAMSTRAKEDQKHFYHASAFITLVASTLYFAMASGSGEVAQGTHLFFFGRYIDWVITTPLLLLDLALVAMPRYPGRSAFLAAFLGTDAYMIVTGFVASYIRSDWRWAWFGASAIAFLVILYYIFTKLRESAVQRNPQVTRLFRVLMLWLVVLWICYPIVWALGQEGFGILSTLPETILYGTLDVLAKVGFGFLLLGNRVTLDRVETTEARTLTGEPEFSPGARL